jgi:hypothetical protein
MTEVHAGQNHSAHGQETKERGRNQTSPQEHAPNELRNFQQLKILWIRYCNGHNFGNIIKMTIL